MSFKECCCRVCINRFLNSVYAFSTSEPIVELYVGDDLEVVRLQQLYDLFVREKHIMRTGACMRLMTKALRDLEELRGRPGWGSERSDHYFRLLTR